MAPGSVRAALVDKLGEPDVKCVFDAREVWHYEKVPMGKDDPRLLTIYLEFEGDRVVKSTGN